MIPRMLVYIVTFGLTVFVISAQAFADPAEGNNLQIDFNTVSKFAHFANAAYQNNDDIKEISQEYGYKLNKSEVLDRVYVKYFLATNDSTRTQIIAIRGTSNLENALSDINIKMQFDKRTRIYLHSGFAEAAGSIYGHISSYLNKDYSINVTGHSLGGAIAVVLAMYLDVDKYKVANVVTFGQPKVTNKSGAAKFSHLNVTRIVTEKDLVPIVPPFDPTDIFNTDIYWHMGKEYILFAGEYYSMLEGLKSMMRGLAFIGQSLNEDNLNAHMMVNYLTLLKSKISKAVVIPYDDRNAYLGKDFK
jgi:triacylglycerol lipase